MKLVLGGTQIVIKKKKGTGKQKWSLLHTSYTLCLNITDTGMLLSLSWDGQYIFNYGLRQLHICIHWEEKQCGKHKPLAWMECSSKLRTYNFLRFTKFGATLPIYSSRLSIDNALMRSTSLWQSSWQFVQMPRSILKSAYKYQGSTTKGFLAWAKLILVKI